MEGLKTDKPVAFVAMPFDESLYHVYLKVIQPALSKHGFKCIRSDEIRRIGIIMEQVQQVIHDSALVLCDLTHENPNVFYEVGIAHTLQKETILVSQSAANIPFNTQHWRVIAYQDTNVGLIDFRDQLEHYLTEHFPNPQNISTDPKPSPIRVTLDELSTHRTALFSNSEALVRFAIKFLGESKDLDSFNRIYYLAIQGKFADEHRWPSGAELKRDAFTALYRIDSDRAFSILIHDGLREQRSFLVRERVVLLLGNYPPDKRLSDDEKSDALEGSFHRSWKNWTLLNQLLAQLKDDSWGVRVAICQVLGKWRTNEASKHLQELLADEYAPVRMAATDALTRIQQEQ